MPLSIIFGWPAVIGVTLGAGLGNLVGDTVSGFTGLSLGIDVIGGSLANLIAATLAWKIGKLGWTFRGTRIAWVLAVNTETAVIALLVGSYLGWLFELPPWISIGGLLAGSIVAISVGGYILLRVLGLQQNLEVFRSAGLVPARSMARPSKEQ